MEGRQIDVVVLKCSGVYLSRWEVCVVQLRESVLGVTHRKLRASDTLLLNGNLILYLQQWVCY